MQFSIIIPCYNASKYLPKLFTELDSYKIPENNAEVIFINDGSSDDTLELLQGYCESRGYARLIHNATQVGVSQGRNQGMESAQGKWLIFLDCDDKYNADFLSQLESAIQAYPKHELFMFQLVFDYEKDGRQEHWVDTSHPEDVITTDAENRFIFNARRNPLIMRTAARVAFKRELIVQHDLQFDSSVENGEDLLFQWHYLLAIESYLAKEKGLTESQAQKLPLEGVFVPSISYYYFQASNRGQRDTDISTKNSLLILTKVMQAFRKVSHHPDVVFDFCKHILLYARYILDNEINPLFCKDLPRFCQELQTWFRIIKEYKFEPHLLKMLQYQTWYLRENITKQYFILAALKDPEVLNATIALFEQIAANLEHKKDKGIEQNSSQSQTDKRNSKASQSAEKMLLSIAVDVLKKPSTNFSLGYKPLTQAMTRWLNGRRYLQILTNTPDILAKLDLPQQSIISRQNEYTLGINIAQSLLVDFSSLNLNQQRRVLKQLKTLIKQNQIETRAFLTLFPSKVILSDPATSNFSPEAEQTINRLTTTGGGLDLIVQQFSGESDENLLKNSLPQLYKKIKLKSNNAHYTKTKKASPLKLRDNIQYRLSSGIIGKFSELSNAGYLAHKLRRRYPLVEMIFFYDKKLSIAQYFRITTYPNLHLVFTSPADFSQFSDELAKFCLVEGKEPSAEIREFIAQVIRHCYLAKQD